MKKIKLDIQMFADGKVVIETELNTNDFTNGLENMKNKANKTGTSIKNMVTALGIDKVITKAMGLIVNSLDDAIARTDTLNNFPRVMSNLGIASEDSSKSIKKMADELTGLPTTLDDGARAVQRFTSKNGDVKKSTDIFLALNNALLAGGASSEIQSTALEQLSQAYAKGKPDMMEWRSVMTAMPAQLKQVATAMGYINADELGQDLREGNISMDEFMNTIIKLNTKGIGNFKSFEEQAKNSTKGINTSITNMKTQVVKGLTDMINSLNTGLKKTGFGGISDVLNNIGVLIRNTLSNASQYITPLLKGISKMIPIIKKLSPIVKKVGVAWLTWSISNKINSLTKNIKENMSITKLLQKATDKLTNSKIKETTAENNQASAQKLNASAIKQVTNAQNSYNTTTKLSTQLSKSFMAVWKANPLGIITTGLSLAVPLIIKFAKWIDKTTESSNKNRNEVDKLVESQKKLNNEISKNQVSRSNNIESIKNEVSSAEILIGQIEKLSNVENKTNAQKEQMASLVEKLNQEMPGLNVEYNKENDSLNESVRAIKEKIQAQQQLILAEAYQENMLKTAKDIVKQERLQAEEEQKLKKSKENLAEATKNLRIFENKYGTNILDMTKQQQSEYAKLQGEVAKYNGNVSKSEKAIENSKQKLSSLNSEMETYKNLATTSFETAEIEKKLSNLINLAKTKGIEVPKRVSEGIMEGSYELPTTIQQLNNLISFDNALKKAKISGNQIPLSISQGIMNGSINIQEAVSQANNWIKFEKAAQNANIDGAKIPENLKNQILNGSISVNDAVNKLLGGINSTAKNKKQETYNTAHDISQNGFVAGYRDGFSYTKGIENAASNLGEKSKSALKKSINAHSPSKDSKEIGGYFLDGFRIGIQDRSKQNSLFSAISNFGSSLLGKLKKSLDEHSPSKATRKIAQFFLQGFDLGIEDEKNNLYKNIDNLGNDMLNKLNNAVNLETGKISTEAQVKSMYSNNGLFVINNNLNASIEMDSQKVGRIVTPVVTKTIKTGGGTL